MIVPRSGGSTGNCEKKIKFNTVKVYKIQNHAYFVRA